MSLMAAILRGGRQLFPAPAMELPAEVKYSGCNSIPVRMSERKILWEERHATESEIFCNMQIEDSIGAVQIRRYRTTVRILAFWL